MSTVNLVKYFFYARNSIPRSRKDKLVALAYAAARDQQLHPKEILIRSDIHNTTSINGAHQKDPNGWHATFAFKNSDQSDRVVHVTAHGYTAGQDDFELKEAKYFDEKEDSSRRGSGKEVWPSASDLVEYRNSPIAYSHLD
ncbi:hypothetical protein BDZ85DRAFT_1356 [Elsinoe ampelina]|uniref:Uncharacterized protein n=1 Tax=Elsinoe ampelina TaxID=302913 RepID=A0A6A6GNE5_9PEZI|nr:hypothetical protein BDZ85DRAFT_1356 [Elsinoe ampelina]